MNIITRFAPSPTGYLHIGSIRTALYSWLYARKYNGKFILRIEDTDINRSNKKYVKHILYVLEWLGLYWDDQPYYQSDRYDFYQDIINTMLNKGLAYKCFCSRERLEFVRNICLTKKKDFLYDGFCRDKCFSYKKKNYIVRFKNIIDKSVFIFYDIVYGKIIISNNKIDDFIIRRSNGIPTYNFCVSLDDYDMCVSHIIRGNDHLNNTPKQIKILDSLNLKVPLYAHLPMILNVNKEKMSKRSKNFNLKRYIKSGFLPESVLNYIVRLGWSYRDKELFSLNEMKCLFSLEKVRKSSCCLNNKKIKWINKCHLSSISYKRLLYYLKPFFFKRKIFFAKINNISEIISFFAQRTDSLIDIVNYCDLFVDKKIKFTKVNHDYISYQIYNLLQFFLKHISKEMSWNKSNITLVINLCLRNYFFLGYAKIFQVLRFFLIGKEKNLSLNIIILFLQKNKVTSRIICSIKFVKSKLKKTY